MTIIKETKDAITLPDGTMIVAHLTVDGFIKLTLPADTELHDWHTEAFGKTGSPVLYLKTPDTPPALMV